MASRSRILWAIFLSLIFSFHIAYAVNLGTLLENNYVNVDSGSIATFTILFWTADNDSLELSVTTMSKPEGWTTILNPILPPSVSDRNVYLPGRGYVRASVEQVYVIVPDRAPKGDYVIVISAVAKDTSSGIYVAQERTFRLNVEVNGKSMANTTTSKVSMPEKKSNDNQQNTADTVNKTPNVTDNKKAQDIEEVAEELQNSSSNATTVPKSAKDTNSITGKAISSGSARVAFLAFATAAILYIAWRIYRREPKMYHYKPPPSIAERAIHSRETFKNLTP